MQEPGALSVEDLYRSYGKRIFNLAYRMTGDRAAADDILQEVFLKVAEHRDTFRGESALYTWMYAIAKNVCLQSKRRSFRHFEKLIAAAEEPPSTASHDEIEWRYYVSQVKDGCLTGLLRCLSFHQRMAFILDVLYGVPTPMISAVLHKSANSVRILVSRARVNLRKFLCKNCSLYDGANRCRCENMINFSLRNAWIKGSDPAASPRIVEAELKELKSEVLLYRSLSEQEPSVQSFGTLMGRRDLLILSRTKVK